MSFATTLLLWTVPFLLTGEACRPPAARAERPPAGFRPVAPATRTIDTDPAPPFFAGLPADAVFDGDEDGTPECGPACLGLVAASAFVSPTSTVPPDQPHPAPRPRLLSRPLRC